MGGTAEDERPKSPSWWSQVCAWWGRLHIPLPYIPKIYTLLKWSFLIIIAVGERGSQVPEATLRRSPRTHASAQYNLFSQVTTALVGFAQSFLVSGVYYVRTKYFITRVVTDDLDWRWSILEYVGVNAALAFCCTFTLFAISPAASGSGIPDVKAFLNGVDVPAFKQFFTIKTFVAKVDEHSSWRMHITCACMHEGTACMAAC